MTTWFKASKSYWLDASFYIRYADDIKRITYYWLTSLSVSKSLLFSMMPTFELDDCWDANGKLSWVDNVHGVAMCGCEMG